MTFPSSRESPRCAHGRVSEVLTSNKKGLGTGLNGGQFFFFFSFGFPGNVPCELFNNFFFTSAKFSPLRLVRLNRSAGALC